MPPVGSATASASTAAATATGTDPGRRRTRRAVLRRLGPGSDTRLHRVVDQAGPVELLRGLVEVARTHRPEAEGQVGLGAVGRLAHIGAAPTLRRRERPVVAEVLDPRP